MMSKQEISKGYAEQERRIEDALYDAEFATPDEDLGARTVEVEGYSGERVMVEFADYEYQISVSYMLEGHPHVWASKWVSQNEAERILREYL